MPAITRGSHCKIENGTKLDDVMVARVTDASAMEKTPPKRKLRSGDAQRQQSPVSEPMNWKSPRRCLNSSPKSVPHSDGKTFIDGFPKLHMSPIKCLFKNPSVKPDWNPKDTQHIKTAKEALHVSTAPTTVMCREDEQSRILNFCKACVEKEKAGSLYVCGCPGTGKSLSMEKVKEQLADWVKESGLQLPDILSINCTSLAKTSDIFTKIMGEAQPQKKRNGSLTPLQHLQSSYSQKAESSCTKMMLIIADELDYLITKDKAVLHNLFMLTTFPFSRCILIGIANAIDLADRFLPRLQALNCKPPVITYRAYSKEQILKILHQRLIVLPFVVFQPQALELCARKVAAVSGDMRKALCVCRNAIELLEAEHKASSKEEDHIACDASAPEIVKSRESQIVRLDHMAVALSKTFKSPAVETIQSLPQHQQIILCSVVKLVRGGKKDTTIGEVNKSYVDICKSTLIPPVGTLELSNMFTVLNDQGLLKLGQSRDDKTRRVLLKVDEADVMFALQGIRFFRNCLTVN
ncbi:cell division control protein 6 homolog B-like [Cucurbita pepo subsp. pepo]|uniref:cell division control protein 6 homolog B-like n=1 Tax=Cucurbita pepo subsp. pepo TaxID=3664 RepID=UPI000C9D586C|nr:cell division control protein 6 homolog B-like [Cucurbita pepo subsp. pepo]